MGIHISSIAAASLDNCWNDREVLQFVQTLNK